MVVDQDAEVCVCVFVKCVNRGYTYTQYTSAGDAPAIGDIPSSKKGFKRSFKHRQYDFQEMYRNG